MMNAGTSWGHQQGVHTRVYFLGLLDRALCWATKDFPSELCDLGCLSLDSDVLFVK